MKLLLLMMLVCINANAKVKHSVFPDGTEIPAWFNDTTHVNVDKLGKKYIITDYGVKSDSNIVQTEVIQKVIDLTSANGGGVIVIPKGTYLSGSLFFKPGTHLYIDEGGVLKGIDAIKYYKIVQTRVEGMTRDYFSALINADHVDGFTISGKGTINGNGKRFWEEFWIRRKINRNCTNLEAMRPRLVYISNSHDVTVSDVHIINSGFWTNHLYKCSRVKYLGVYIYAPTQGEVKAPSSDALDIDACTDVLVNGCYMNVNDDAVCLKGGKGTYVEKDSTNGPCRNIIVQNCVYGEANAGITFGSESYDDRNIILRNCDFHLTNHIVLFKMRPDTPQKYEYVLVENITGDTKFGVTASPWMQFYNKLNRDDMPRSICSNVTLRNIKVSCSDAFYDVRYSKDYDLSNFTFENIKAKSVDGAFNTSIIFNCKIKDVEINSIKYTMKR